MNFIRINIDLKLGVVRPYHELSLVLPKFLHISHLHTSSNTDHTLHQLFKYYIISEMVFKGKLKAEDIAYARLLKKHGQSCRDIAKSSNMSKSSVQRQTRSSIQSKQHCRGHTKIGRPTKISPRLERYILREFKKLRSCEGSFSIARLMSVTGLNQRDITIRSISNLIHRAGYGLYNARKKGLLSAKDLKDRVNFAKRMINRPVKFWCDEVSFYLDAVSFTYKSNPHDQARAPRSKVYRKPSEGLLPSCTSRGRKEGTGGKTVKFVVAITHGKGVVVCEPYDKMNGEYFASFVDRNFMNMFEIADKDSFAFVQDGDPSQNSAVAKLAMKRANAQMLSIPPRSPDLNPIENFFNVVRTQLHHGALSANLTHETFEQFQERVEKTMRSVPTDLIDNTIASIRKRLQQIIEGKGHRTKY